MESRPLSVKESLKNDLGFDILSLNRRIPIRKGYTP